ncbi:MAG: MFS transporter, partial [Deltaproteobacteria bacterium]|nr:MFS transporter [Deltaproteobacteria bacterium]
MYGRRTMLLISLFFFTTGSILASVSPTFVFNIIARVIIGLGLGALSALCFSVVGDLFTAPAEKSKWTGLLNLSAGVAAIFGPVLVGIITDNLSWRYFFWVVVPIAIVCVILVISGVPGRTERAEHHIDYAGAFMLAIASSAMILGISFTDRYSWISFYVMGLLIISIVFWFLFILVELKAKEPILDPQVFTNRTFLTAAIAAFLSFFGFVGIMNYYPLFAQGVQGASAKLSGAMLTPFTVLMAFTGVPAGLLIARTKRYKWIFIMSYGVLTAAMFMLFLFNQATPIWLGVIVMIFGGFGVGAIPTTNILVVQFALPKRFRGVSVAAIFFIVALGTAAAPAILGPAMNATYEKSLKSSLPQDLDHHIDAATLESIADPRVLMSKGAMEEVKKAFEKNQDINPALFNETVQAVRSALQAGLKVLFLIGAIALLIAFLFIVTIPEVPIESGGLDEEPNKE